MPETKLVFVGHDFFGNASSRKVAYRARVRAGCTRANGSKSVKAKNCQYQAIYGDTRLDENAELRKRCQKMPDAAGRYWVRIQNRIRACDLALFDLTNRRFSNALNANVLLEYGLALGLEKRCFPFGTNRRLITKHLSNIAGITLEQYSDDAEFSGLEDFVRGMLILHAVPPVDA